MATLIQDIKNKLPDLRQAQVEGVLAVISDNPGISSADLVRVTGLPKETLRQFKSTISTLLEKSDEDALTIKKEYITQLKELDIKPFDWTLVSLEDREVENALRDFRKAYDFNPDRTLDQFFADESSSVAKAKILDKKGLLTNANIALLGDDDLLSFTINSISDEWRTLAVFDVDDRILQVVKDLKPKKSTNSIQAVLYDAANEVSEKFSGRYDVVVTDPPYTKTGVTLFLNRAVQLLGQGAGKYIFLYYGNSFKSPEKTLKIQEIINRFSLVIEDKIDNFARYYGAESIGSASSLYILKTTPFTAPVFEFAATTNLYTHQNQKEEKFPFVDHVVFKLYDVPAQLIESKGSLLKALGDFCSLHKLKVVDQKLTKFKGQGMTITFVLANSNLVVHTWPEYNALHIDLITCSPIYNKDQLIKTLSGLFKPKSIEMRAIE